MLTAAETTKLRHIKALTLVGRAREVSRADKQWVLDLATREGKKVAMATLMQAHYEGFDVTAVPVQI